MHETKSIIECSSLVLCKSGSWKWNIKEETISLSDGWKRMLGFTSEEIKDHISEWIERLHPNDKFKTLKILTSLKKDANQHFDFYYRIKNKSGSYCWMNCYGSATEFDDNNTATIITGVQQDVDDLKTSEEYYREVNLRLGKLSENFGGGILLENEERKIFFINQQFCDYFNIPVAPEFLLGGDCSNAAENSKHLFKDPNLFISNVNTILENKVPVFGEVYEMKNRVILERDYIPIFEEQRYKGHLWIYRNITRFKENEDKLQFRLHFEELITKLSAKFINLAWKDVDKEIDEALGMIGNFISADRSYVFLFCDEGKFMSNTHEWVKEGVPSEKESLKYIPTDIFPWWMNKINNQEAIYIPSVEELPIEANAEKEILEPQGIKSLIVVPMIYSNGVIGYIGFDSIHQAESWTEDSIKLLTMAASVITNAIKRKENEEALSKSESQYRIVVNTIKEVIFQTDRGGNWIFLNPAWTEITGYTLEESIGQNFSAFIHKDEKIKNFDLLQRLIEGKKEYSLHDIVIVTKDAQLKTCEVYVRPLCDDKNYVIGISGTVRDITRQRESEQEIRKLNRAIETIETGILLTDFKGIISYVNPGLISIFGFKSSNNIIGKSIFLLASNEGTTVLKKAIITRLMSGNNWKGEIELRKANGKFFPAEAICSVVHDDNDKPLYIVANFYDITERKKAEFEVRKSLIKERELSELKTKFVSMVSHEFRTPLAAIHSSSDLIEMYWDKLNEEKRTSLLAKIKISVKNLIEILSDVTEINKVDSGKATVTLEQVDVVNLINDMIDEVKQGYPVSAKISFTSEKQSLVLNSDKKLLRQVFINLINNAVKYTDPKKSIYISLEHQPDLTIFKVEDEGIGIPGEDFDTLFEPFMRSKNTGKIKGTGLGLSILKRAVDLLGGRVDFSSTLNVGSTFTVYLPNDISIIQEDEIKHEFNFL